MAKCKFFRWADASPSASPPTAQSATMANVLNVPLSFPTATVNHVTLTGDGTCAHPDCQTTRLAPGCVNKRCRRHCRLLGNCDVKSHAVNVSVPAPSALPGAPWGSHFPSQSFSPSVAMASIVPHASTSASSIPHADAIDAHQDFNHLSSQTFIPLSTPASTIPHASTSSLYVPRATTL